ncbi:hypothetical protein ACLB2K_045523 [Fragaria x ananassa]
MDPEQTFIRVQERFSQILTPKVRAGLEYIYLFIAMTLFSILVVMHANYVQQPGCSSELPGVETADAQIIHVKISSAGLWSQNESDFTNHVPQPKLVMDKLELANVGGDDGLTSETLDHQGDSSTPTVEDAVLKTDVEETRVCHSSGSMPQISLLVCGTLQVYIWILIFRSGCIYFDQTGLTRMQWLENRSKMEKGYFLLPESARAQHNIRTVNISISARHSCFGNRWRQLLINRFVGYDTILINSLSSPGQGYRYNFQTKEPPEGPARFGDYLVAKNADSDAEVHSSNTMLVISFQRFS